MVITPFSIGAIKKSGSHGKIRQALYLFGRQPGHLRGKVAVSYQNGVTVSLDSFDPNQILQLLKLGNV